MKTMTKTKSKGTILGARIFCIWRLLFWDILVDCLACPFVCKARQDFGKERKERKKKEKKERAGSGDGSVVHVNM